jgi:hypothetical protein
MDEASQAQADTDAQCLPKNKVRILFDAVEQLRRIGEKVNVFNMMALTGGKEGITQDNIRIYLKFLATLEKID